MYENKTDDLILATLVADTYCLSSHWVYDRKELKNLKINWAELGDPSVDWHGEKKLGDFTHYGDQIKILLSYLEQNNATFDVEKYIYYWASEISKIDTYMDGATKETIENLAQKKPVPCGSNAHDMAAVGRAFALLKVSQTKEEFLANTRIFVKATHDNVEVLEATHFFSSLLLAVLDGEDIVQSIESLKNNYSKTVQTYIQSGLDSKDADTQDTLHSFGTHCGVEVGMSGVVHILSKYDNYEEALIANAHCGGDNSSRAMIIGAILIAKGDKSQIPLRWQKHL
ncbi:ADP-ribosylglycohydrolase family protein [Sulfurimonas sp. SAG-AH-194-C20]|nr:ADP-ribosylglycohydrolase family protein [Sulfurimonas sp. SAG-AH-194-C20]MDF1878307.1 ADP-ribosylglycohydrolase family protein [Sulfurimonas sp. SAG-AH-194-C20]